jgi:hypothetical protein
MVMVFPLFFSLLGMNRPTRQTVLLAPLALTIDIEGSISR